MNALKSHILLSLILLFLQGCGSRLNPGRAIGESMGNAVGTAIEHMGSTPMASAVVELSDFEMVGIRTVHIIMRGATGSPTATAVNGAAFSLSIQADGQTAGEIQTYFQGSLREVRGDELTITLGDRDLNCMHQSTNGTVVGIHGICLEGLTVTIPTGITVDTAATTLLGGTTTPLPLQP